MDWVDVAKMYSPAAIAYDVYRHSDFLKSLTGQKQMENMQASAKEQIGYEEYLRGGNERALADWQYYVGSQGKSIRYPEFSYPGQIYRANTAIARAGYDYANAGANYYGNLPYRLAGLYGVSSKLARTL